MSHQKESWTKDPERRLALYRELEGKVASGEAFRLRRVWILTNSGGTGINLLVEESLLPYLYDCVEGKCHQDFVHLEARSPHGMPLDVRLSYSFFGGFIEERGEAGCWFLMDGKVYRFFVDEIEQFKGMKQKALNEGGTCTWEPDDIPMSSGYVPGCKDEIRGYGTVTPSALCPFCNKPMVLDAEGWH